MYEGLEKPRREHIALWRGKILTRDWAPTRPLRYFINTSYIKPNIVRTSHHYVAMRTTWRGANLAATWRRGGHFARVTQGDNIYAVNMEDAIIEYVGELNDRLRERREELLGLQDNLAVQKEENPKEVTNMTGEQLNRLVTMAYQTGATIAVIHELDDNITKLEGYVTDSMRRALTAAVASTQTEAVIRDDTVPIIDLPTGKRPRIAGIATISAGGPPDFRGTPGTLPWGATAPDGPVGLREGSKKITEEAPAATRRDVRREAPRKDQQEALFPIRLDKLWPAPLRRPPLQKAPPPLGTDISDSDQYGRPQPAT